MLSAASEPILNPLGYYYIADIIRFVGMSLSELRIWTALLLLSLCLSELNLIVRWPATEFLRIYRVFFRFSMICLPSK